MVYKKIAIIGLGTLGGFVADSIATLEGVEKLVIVDHDDVESKNIINSIYRPIDIGTSKVEALSDIILSKENDIQVEAIGEKFIEGESDLPKCDLVLDCRDYTYDRGDVIDARLYISSRYLIVDCRMNVSYPEKTEGKYLIKLNKDDLRSTANIVAMMVSCLTFEHLKKLRTVQKYEIDFVKNIDNHCYDVIFDNTSDVDKFVNLPDTIVPILDMNKKNDLNLVVGSRLFPIAETIIPKKSLMTTEDIVKNFSELTKAQSNFNNYVVTISDNKYIELLPETGAA